jgi:SpoIIAA-like
MIKQIEGMPDGTIGFEASGKLSREDYRDVLEPVLRKAAESGEIRMLFKLSDLHGLQPGAWYQDVKTGLGLGIGHHKAWKRSAIVTNVDWVGKAFELFAWMTPGEVKVYRLDREDDARAWVVG